MDWIPGFLLGAAALLGAGMALWSGYYLLTALSSWRKPADYGQHPAAARIAILIAARNEELVLPDLIESLLAQRYPKRLYDIWVIPNNCTDHTAQAAQRAGARVLPCAVPVHCKGDALAFAYEQLKGQGYDAFCVFDADNVVHPLFLQEMNNAYCAGASAAQGYRDSKNPYGSPVSGCSSIYYWMMNRFHNQGKAGLGQSALLGGTGFLISAAALEKLGGWHTQSISEDLELSVQCAQAGIPIAWVPKAITYDEQPLTLRESLKQRRRWTSGTLQVAADHLPLSGGLSRPLSAFDMGATLLVPHYQAAALPSLAVASLAAGFAPSGPFSALLCLACWAGNLALAALGATAAALLVLALENKWDRRLLPALGLYWFFLLLWAPLTVRCLIRRTTAWEEIRHTCSLSLSRQASTPSGNQALLP